MTGFAMELYSRGLLTKKDTDGLKLDFGDVEESMELLKMIVERRGVGDVLARGSRAAAEKIGRGAEKYAMHVKGMELVGYEPRAFYGMALTYSTSTRGACHNVGGWTIRDELIKKTYDRYALKGKGRLVKILQDIRAYIDSLGVCTIPRRSLGLSDKPNEELVNLITGMDFRGKLVLIGERIYNLERLILNRENITRKDDALPERMRREPLPDGMAKGHVITDVMFKEMLDEYYRERGWNRNGQVTTDTQARLGIL